MGNSIELKTIGDILTSKYTFYIDSYQRGYRWDKQQVTDLLNDISKFIKTSTRDDFYCLQPVIIKPIEIDGLSKYEVIDGQQRLTTIYVILSYIKSEILPKVNLSFTLEYKTRPESQAFLEKMDSGLKDKYVDFYYMYSAYKYVKEWFEEQPDETTAGTDIHTGLREQTKVIWYEVDKEVDSVDIFTRINIGKIALTNAELIKALFLKKNGADKERTYLKQLEIASEWDGIEYALGSDEFWYFLNGGLKYSTRIEYIFDAMLGKFEAKSTNQYYSFLKFNRLFEDKQDIDSMWLMVKKYFMTLEEWYGNREIYHLIGYLVSTDTPIYKIKSEVEDYSKKEFHNYLQKKIRETVKTKKHLSELEFDTDKPKIKKILLLFNIISILHNESSNTRFPFNLYKLGQWDIEHIHAVHSKMPNRVNERIDWIHEINDLTGENYKDEIAQEDDMFEELYIEVLGRYIEGDDDINVNNISNLALLDAKTNRSYGNSVFPIKRKNIIEKDKTGEFIPLCTKNVFLKYYSENIEQMSLWGVEDREYYTAAIKHTLRNYLETEEEKQ